VRGHPGLLERVAPQHEVARALCESGRLGEEARLADARLARHRDQAAAAASTLVERPSQPAELGVPPDEILAHARHGILQPGDGADAGLTRPPGACPRSSRNSEAVRV